MPTSAHRQGDPSPFETVLGQTIGEELLARRDVALKSLGVFRVVHRHPTPVDSPDGGLELTPPADDVTFTERAGSAPAGLRSEEMSLEGALVLRTGWMPHRVSAALRTFVQQAEERISQGESFRIHGVGELHRNFDGEWVFTPEAGLALHVNHRYAGLKPVVLRYGDAAADPAGGGTHDWADEPAPTGSEPGSPPQPEMEAGTVAAQTSEPAPAHEHENLDADSPDGLDDAAYERNGQAGQDEWHEPEADPSSDRPSAPKATVPEHMEQWEAAPIGKSTENENGNEPSEPEGNRRLIVTLAVVAVVTAGAAWAYFMPLPVSTTDLLSSLRDIPVVSTRAEPDSDPEPAAGAARPDAPSAAQVEARVEPAQQEPAASSGPYGLFGTFKDDLPGRFVISIHVGSDLDVLAEKAANLLSMNLRVHLFRVPEEVEPTWLLSIGQFDLESDALAALEQVPQQLAGEPLQIIELP